jgi:hypothetical protein
MASFKRSTVRNRRGNNDKIVPKASLHIGLQLILQLHSWARYADNRLATLFC